MLFLHEAERASPAKMTTFVQTIHKDAVFCISAPAGRERHDTK